MDLPVTSAQVPAIVSKPSVRVVYTGRGFRIERLVVKPQKWYRRLLGGGREVESWVFYDFWCEEAHALSVAAIVSKLPLGYEIRSSSGRAGLFKEDRYVTSVDPTQADKLLERAQAEAEPKVIAEFP